MALGKKSITKTTTIFMKNNLTLSMALCLIVFSCKKEDQSQIAPQAKSDAKKYAVNFDVSSFSQSVESMRAKGSAKIMAGGSAISAMDSLKNRIDQLRYLVYDSAGMALSSVNQQYLANGSFYSYKQTVSGNDGTYGRPFGSIVDSLPSGKYSIVFLGTNMYNYLFNDRFDEDWEVPLNLSNIFDDRSLDFSPLATGETFYKKLSIVVAKTDLKQDVCLDRVTGKLEINIKDAIPANANKFDFRFYEAPNTFYLGSGTASERTNYGDETDEDFGVKMWHPVQIKDSEKGMTNYKVPPYIVFGSDKMFTVEIRCFDASNKLIAKKTVSNVQVFKNKRTILTGKLFDNNSQALFNVTVNSDWNLETENVTF